tara:strand:+ start:1798 stop:2202 length:405 start_codon:yes stop_codon:yes gene_type:complete
MDTPMTKKEIMDRLIALEVVKVYVEYSGGHDDGGVDHMEATFTSGRREEQDPDAHWPTRVQHPSAHFTDISRTEAQETARVWGAIAELHGCGSFAGDWSVNGTIIVDVKKDMITIKGDKSREYTEPFDYYVEHN